MSVFQRLTSRRLEFGLLILAAIIIGVAMVNLEIAVGNELTKDVLYIIFGYIGVFTVAHLSLCFLAPLADQIMLPVAALLNGLGLIMIYRIDAAKETALATRQVMWTLVGIIMMVLVMVIIRDHKVLSRYSYILGVIGLVLLALPMVWPIQPDTVADAKIWITLGPFSIQPGEFSKILLLLFFAQLLVNKRALFTVAGYRFLGMEFPRLRDLAPIMLVWAIAMVIMAGENDFGPALLLFATVLGMIYLATNRASWLLIGLLLVAIGGFGIFQISNKIQARFSLFLDPVGNWETSSQLAQALFGMSWGGIMGTGLGQGYPHIVPVSWSDFILSTVGEELGLVGLSAVLVLFMVFVSRGMRTALQVKDSYGKLVAAGLSLTLVIQIFVVTAGISALMPMTGLTTPFMSAGGSSLMANYILLGLVLRISDSAQRPYSQGAKVVANHDDTSTQLHEAVR
ncbi:FtsW/RodA/SpoVE family cell cycle protein [Corynebacterium hindlerae]|uniref:FtsW/RodA/SpoVE family cell cycle protein n=1 Tax=Corynebacterium hindlerae TaxID=699041 RepID=A0A7G5FCH7_9CORY|nr:FtsW/RodA/SpoVE family cell cycle protein [Corynebacterium hindlerae]QMV84318.1 FtsW/RodA/SpoVE family cell cycle protein [Corynebacterium hindlerae]